MITYQLSPFPLSHVPSGPGRLRGTSSAMGPSAIWVGHTVRGGSQPRERGPISSLRCYTRQGRTTWVSSCANQQAAVVANGDSHGRVLGAHWVCSGHTIHHHRQLASGPAGAGAAADLTLAAPEGSGKPWAEQPQGPTPTTSKFLQAGP